MGRMGKSWPSFSGDIRLSELMTMDSCEWSSGSRECASENCLPLTSAWQSSSLLCNPLLISCFRSILTM